MKIALIHELLTMKGGAERVLKILSEMFPDAPIYTLLYNEDILSDWFPPERVQGSSLQNIASRIPLPQRYNHHLYLPFFPTAVEAWDFSNFDIVLSLSSAFVHGIITNSAPKHLSYINSPARYLWDRTHEILTNAGKGILGPMRKPIASSLFHRLRVWDAEAADRADQLACSSQHVKRRVELYWGRDARVIYPPIEDFWFEGEKNNAESYYLIVSTLVPYKRIEIAIEACNALRIPLKIAGSGPDLSRLKKIAQKTAHPLEGSQVEFLGFQTENNLRDLYIHARATIFPGEEDFGLVPVESMACGTPVVALKKGGAIETVIEGETGLFFRENSAESLKEALTKMKHHSFNPLRCRDQARHFRRERFENEILNALSAL